MFNKITLIGRLGQNAEARTAQNNRDYAIFNVATQEGWKNDKGEYETILRAAVEYDGFVQMLFRPGQFVLQGEPLGRVYAETGHYEFARHVEPAIVLGRHRVLEQDFEFGIAQIVEIAIRALSPAVNDTFTGVACVDLLGEALLLLYTDPKTGSSWFDTHGILRLQVRPVRLPRLVRQAFDQIRQAAASNPAVSIRLLTTMARLISDAVHGGGLLGLSAVISQLDLVITIDSLAAHLAGAMGKPVWILLKHDADWRWMRSRATVPGTRPQSCGDKLNAASGLASSKLCKPHFAAALYDTPTTAKRFGGSLPQ